MTKYSPSKEWGTNDDTVNFLVFEFCHKHFSFQKINHVVQHYLQWNLGKLINYSIFSWLSWKVGLIDTVVSVKELSNRCFCFGLFLVVNESGFYTSQIKRCTKHKRTKLFGVNCYHSERATFTFIQYKTAHNCSFWFKLENGWVIMKLQSDIHVNRK